MKNKNTKNNKSVWSVIGVLGLLALGKLKYVLIIFKFLKLQTLFSMLIYLGTYALMYGWKFAVALVYLLFVHEMGHAYAAKKIKLPTSPALFIPFVGAVIGLKEMPKNAKDEGYVAYMGPLFGLLSFLPAIPLYLYTDEPFWALVIILGGILNLFNLIPITPLDGGRIVAGISTKLWGIGLILLFIFSVIHFSILGFIILILGSIQWYNIHKKQKDLNKNKSDEENLRTIIHKLKEEFDNIESVEKYIKEAKQQISQQEINQILEVMESDIEKIKKNIMLQQLSGIHSLSEEEKNENEQVVKQFIALLEEKSEELHKDIKTTETYYKTDKKTKVKLFLIYIGLVAALSVSYYYGNEILMNSPEVQKVMNNE